MTSLIGCLSERSFTIRADESRTLTDVGQASAGRSTRSWLRNAHGELRDLLPASSPPALLTEDLVGPEGQPVDVFGHFGVRRKSLHSMLSNWEGITFTAQAACRTYCIDQPAPSWDGFEDVWIPVDHRTAYNTRIGYARRNGEIVDADCIVLLPGLYGDNGVQRTKDLAIYLRDAGFHVAAVELRGHGQTEARYPGQYHTFGVIESNDMLVVSDWLEAQPHVNRTGLIGYCWGANVALLTAWYEATQNDDPCISSELATVLQPRERRPRYTAGVIAFSPIVRWEALLDELDEPRSNFTVPVYAAIQQTVRDRAERKGFPEPHHSLRQLIEQEYIGYNVPMPNGVYEGYPFIRVMPYKDNTIHDKMALVRTPLLIVHAATDPLAPAQDVADFVSTVENPLVAAAVLPNGGHVGFAAYAKEYYFSLITNFFDPQVGPAGVARSDAAASAVRPAPLSRAARSAIRSPAIVPSRGRVNAP